MNRTDKIFFMIAILSSLLLLFLVVYFHFTAVDFQKNNIAFKAFPIILMLVGAWLQTRIRELPMELAFVLRCSMVVALIAIVIFIIKIFIIGSV